MTFREAKKDFLRGLMLENKCLTIAELKKVIGSTTIRCYWCDYVDYLARDGQITERQRFNWGQVI